MKRNFLSVSVFSLAIAALAVLPSCAGNEKKADNNIKTATAAPAANPEELPNYRYVDLDTILSNYNLAKDYNEDMIKRQNNLESEVKRHENSIQAFASSMQKKLQNNGYLSEESYKADQDKINNMQATAQRSVANLQSNFEQAANNAQKAVSDSIQSFIKDYNAQKGYDAIFMKAATLYINPALDITAEVVEGLNERYNKVKK